MSTYRPECAEVFRQLDKPVDPDDPPCPSDCDTTRPYCECMCHGYSNDEPGNWLTRVFAQAEAMFADLPLWAHPVVTRRSAP